MPTNLLITALPAEEQARLRPTFERVRLREGQVLIEAGQPVSRLWFPEDAVVLTAQRSPAGLPVAAGLTGVDGFVGLELLLGQPASPFTATVAVAGEALRMTAGDLHHEVLEPGSPLQQAMTDAAFHFLAMQTQMALCLRQHSVPQRLCRWLRMMAVRLPQRDELPAGSDVLAILLGLDASAVHAELQALATSGVIEYQDGSLRVTHPQKLAKGCCPCLAVFQRSMTRLLRASAVAEAL